ncbi:hypothetical protein [Saccharothrix sp. ALI-22-I]|uniref:hypothetical protein n=1 Tax=Saccharothrix sp. ALI-22-I TaxID=1933778 RepID=UPI001179F26E|nr:hypothetical protein [Saccharothrix sp. ALI-22-I]
MPIAEATGGPGRMLTSTDYQVTVGKTYDISVWSSGCLYGPIGAATKTVQSSAISASNWQVRV